MRQREENNDYQIKSKSHYNFYNAPSSVISQREEHLRNCQARLEEQARDMKAEFEFK